MARLLFLGTRLKADADARTPLLPVKPDIKQVCKHGQGESSRYFSLLKNRIIFFQNRSNVFLYNGLIPVLTWNLMDKRVLRFISFTRKYYRY